MVFGVVQVDVHLPDVGVGELVERQVHDDEAPEPSVVEDELDAEPHVVEPQALLPTDRGEVAAQFEQECLEVSDEGILEVALRVLVPEVEELEHQGVFDLLCHRHGVAGIRLLTLQEHRRLTLRESRSFEELAADLALQLANGPTTGERFAFVKCTSGRALHPEQRHVVRPREGETRHGAAGFGRRCLPNLARSVR